MSLAAVPEHALHIALDRVRVQRCSGAVLEALARENAPLGERQRTNLELLRSGKAIAAVTGQQLGLFLGPLFTFYKTASLLAWAEALTERLGTAVVPIFWLQSEDHDLEEAAQLSLLKPDGALEACSLFSPEFRRENRISVGSISLPAEVEQALAKLLAVTDAPDERMASVFSSHYRPGKSMSEAFSGALRDIFGPDGLLVFDCRPATLRREIAPLLEQLLLRRGEVAEKLAARTRKLEEEGVVDLVKLRSDSPLFFFHPDGPDKPRFRLSPAGTESWSVAGSSRQFSTDEILERIRSAPEHFSSSALLRPLIQNTLLPVLAYVAGPAERVYWRQLEPLWKTCGVSESLVLPRLRATILEPKSRRLLDQLSLSSKELDRPIDSLRLEVLSGSLPPELLPDEVQRRVRSGSLAQFAALLQAVSAHDPQLASELTRSAEKIERAAQGFLDRYRELLSRRDGTQLERLSRLLSFTHPRGQPQERVCAFATFWCKYGGQLREAARTEFRSALRTDAGLQILSLN